MSQDPLGVAHPPATPAHKGKSTAGAICKDTPLKANSHTVEAGHANVPILRGFLEQELDSMPWFDGGQEFLDTAFQNITTPGNIRKFLKSSKTYNSRQKRWTAVPSGVTATAKEATLYPGFLKIMKEILNFSDFKVRNRKVVPCSGTNITHQNDGQTYLATSPDFAIMGRKGKSFKEKNFPHIPTYAQCVSPVEIKTDESKESFRRQVIQVATYARQCFIEQHNRLKVYSVLITETTVQLLQFDRGGIMHSAKCNFHENPETFIRIILGLASDGVDAGFDTSVYWDKGKRWLQTLDTNGTPVVYEIVGDSPVFIRRTVCGRGTCCWHVRDPNNGQEYLIKESWRSEEREPETTFLEVAKGLPGVAQMVAHEDDEQKTIVRLRGFDDEQTGFKNRIWYRVTLERYGKSLDDFTDPLQLLEAYRDIIAAEMGLWGVCVVHRDVTIDNTVLGKDKAIMGWRGVLIDLDMAAFITRRESLESTNTRTGSRAFQSINVLRTYVEEAKKPKGSRKRSLETVSGGGPQPFPHNFLDDLESLFYILCWVCYRRDKDGKLIDLPEWLGQWDSNDAETAKKCKSFFLNEPLPPLPAFFRRGGAFKFLLESLQQTFRQIVHTKAYGRDTDQEKQTLEATFPEASPLISSFIQLVDQAIQLWKKGDEGPVQGHKTRAVIIGMTVEPSASGPGIEAGGRDAGTEELTVANSEPGAASTSMTRFPLQMGIFNPIKRPRDLSPIDESDEDDLPIVHSPTPRRHRMGSRLVLNSSPASGSGSRLLLKPKRKKAKTG